MSSDHAFSKTSGPGPAVVGPAAEPVPEPAAPDARLPNAMVGRRYSAEIGALLADDFPPFAGFELINPLPPGLELQDGALTGQPEAAGELEVRLRGHLCEPEPEAAASVEILLALRVNPDPRSLWKNLPSDQGGEFWKPDTATGFLPDGPLTVIGASLRGRSHAHVGSFRDDDMAMAWFPEAGWYSLTVADGAGSAKFSRQGSKIACDSVAKHFADYFGSPEPTLNRLVADHAGQPDDPAAATAVRNELYDRFGKSAVEAIQALEKQAAEVEATARDFHTTLITVLVHPLADGRWFVAAFSVGDGAAALVGVPDAQPCLLTRPDGGEFAGQTVFLTMGEALASWEAITARIQMAVVPSFDAILLVTDGISDPRFESENALAESAAWNALWNEIRDAAAGSMSPETASAAVLEWMAFHSPGHHDDRTLVLATSAEIFPRP